MAKFTIAEGITGGNEGLYANNPADTGGETWAGIARSYWPKWKGWSLIDIIKIQFGNSAKIINKYGSVDPNLKSLVSSFYKQNFWDINKLDQFNNQQLANTVYDFGVNSGTGRSAKFLQQAVNDLGVFELGVDGSIGNMTLSAVNNSDSKRLYDAFNKRRTDFYVSIAKGSQAQFLKSWLSRIKPYKS